MIIRNEFRWTYKKSKWSTQTSVHARQFQRQESITQTGIMLEEATYELAKRSRDMYKQKTEPEDEDKIKERDKPNLDIGE